MPSKQELIEIMDNRVPGARLPLRDPPLVQPSAYPVLERISYASQQQQQFFQLDQAKIYTLRYPTTNNPAPQLGKRSHLAYCPSCHATQMTRCEYESSIMTHIIATILCLTTCCCCLPYFCNNCKSARHYCQNCGTYLGVHNK